MTTMEVKNAWMQNAMASFVMNAEPVKADVNEAEKVMAKENSFKHRLQQAKGKKFKVMDFVFPGEEHKDIDMDKVMKLLFEVNLMNLKHQVVTVAPGKVMPKFGKAKDFDGSKWTDLREVVRLLYFAWALKKAGMVYTPTMGMNKMLIDADNKACTDIVAA